MKPKPKSHILRRLPFIPKPAAFLLVTLRLGQMGSLADPIPSGNELVYSNALHEIQIVYSEAFRNMPSSQRETNLIRFRRALTNLASADLNLGQMTPEQATLFDVARSVGTNSRQMDELLALYGDPANATPKHVLVPPQLRSAHISETYRPAWEALLLAPETDELRL